MADVKQKDKKMDSRKLKSDEDNISSASSDSAVEDHEDRKLQICKGVGAGAIAIDRDTYLTAYRELFYDRSQLQMKNNILHRRLAEYYKKRKQDQVLKPIEGSPDLEDKYVAKLYSYEEMKEKEEREINEIKTKVDAVQLQYKDRLEHANNKFDELQILEKNTGAGLIYAKKGKPISDKTVDRLLFLQKRKSEQTSALRLRYIRARNAVAELESVIKRLEMLGPGLYVAHYEQLNIDNQNFKSKIEEREDELIKNRMKYTEHNQILAHIREKMHHTDEVIDMTECDLGDAEIEIVRAREDLATVKTRRDKLRWSLETERLKAGLLTRKDLLRDYQDATDEVVTLRAKKASLEALIAKTSKELREARKIMQQPVQRNNSFESNNTILN